MTTTASASANVPHLASPELNPSFTKVVSSANFGNHQSSRFSALTSEGSEPLRLILDAIREFADRPPCNVLKSTHVSTKLWHSRGQGLDSPHLHFANTTTKPCDMRHRRVLLLSRARSRISLRSREHPSLRTYYASYRLSHSSCRRNRRAALGRIRVNNVIWISRSNTILRQFDTNDLVIPQGQIRKEDTIPRWRPNHGYVAE
jgi:hypothetical protein